MAEATVILADTDACYLASLEVKFLEELGERINLHLITEESYFYSFFSKPRKAEILVVGENLYMETIEKHAISHIFILTEQREEMLRQEENGRNRGAVTKIYKYTSVKDIYSRIMAVGKECLCAGVNCEEKSQIAVVYAPVGGVGKTVLALGMSGALAENGARVLYLNAERMNTFQCYLRNQELLKGEVLTEVLEAVSYWEGSGQRKSAEGMQRLYQTIRSVIRREGFAYFPPLASALSVVNQDISFYETLLQAMKESGEYDVILVDTDTVFDRAKASLLATADKVFVVTDGQERSAYAMDQLLGSMSCSDSEKFFFIGNHVQSGEKQGSASDGRNMHFAIQEWVGHLEHTKLLTLEELAKHPDIRRICYLLF